MEIKDILHSRRKELNLTQKQVAEAVGVDDGTVSRWESGEIINMRRDRILALSNILRLDPQVIMGDSSADSDSFQISFKEKCVISAYRDQPEIQPAVDRLLKLEEYPLRMAEAEPKEEPAKIAAFGGAKEVSVESAYADRKRAREAAEKEQKK